MKSRIGDKAATGLKDKMTPTAMEAVEIKQDLPVLYSHELART